MFGIILAGGSGSRLWPLSRDLYPKQLLRINSKTSLLEDTFLRLGEIMPQDNIISITNKKHESSIRTQLQAFTQDLKILAEPAAKNTAPAISVCIKYLTQNFEDDVVLVMPSDHLIKDTEAFKKTVEIGEKYARKGYIVTFGIKPTSPHTGYGYIKAGEKEADGGYEVCNFKEKPNAEVAQEYFEAGNYFWNAGIFMFKMSTYLEALKEHANDIYSLLEKFDFRESTEIPYIPFEKMPSISIDYAIMEHAKNIKMVPLMSDWNDLGSWDAIYEIDKKDEEGNVKVGHVETINCKDSLFFSSNRLVTGIGLEDTIIVETADAILACKKDQAQDVKKIYEKLKEVKDETHLVHTTVYRPWGYYTVLNQGEGYLTKMICVSKKAQLSLQSHNFRSEHWVVLSGVARVTLEDKTFMLKPGSSIDIPVKAKHSLANPYNEELKIIEVQKGDKLIEEDIIRYKDIYGRVKA